MSLFQCTKCGGRENTACAPGYWLDPGEKICCFCSTGKWHDEFPRLLLPKGEFKTNREGNLEHIETGSTDLKRFELEQETTLQQALEIAESDACYTVEETVKAGQIVAAAYRKLTTLRPMADAPVGDFAYYRNRHTKKLYAGFKTQSGKIRTANGGTYVPTVFDGWLPNPELATDLLFSIDGDSKTP